MVDIRGFNGGMNSDASPELLQQGDYSYALNIENGADGISNLLGNRLIEGLEPSEGGKGWVCGSHFDKTRQRIIYFVHNWRGYHRIASYELPTSEYPDGRNFLLFEDSPTSDGTQSVFDWGAYRQYNPLGLIKDIKIIHRQYEGDLVYFIDPNKNLLKFNYNTLLQWKEDNVAVKFDYFKVIKAPPKEVISVDIVDDSSTKVNNLYKKLFQFKYRYVYDDNEKSVWSAISKIPIPLFSSDPLFNSQGDRQNAVEMKLFTGDLNVRKIEIAGRVNIESSWSDFFLVDSLDKDLLDIADNTLYTYLFKNDGVYVPIDLQESNLLFDFVPDEANALELANGNTLVVGGIKDGYSKLPKIDSYAIPVLGNSPSTISTLLIETKNADNTGSFSPNSFNEDYNTDNEPKVSGLVKFSGTPQVGDIIEITLTGANVEKWFGFLGGANYKIRQFTNTWSVTVQPGWGISDIIDAFINHPGVDIDPWNYSAKFSTSGPDYETSTRCKPFGVPNFAPEPDCLYFGAFVDPPPGYGSYDRRSWVFNGVSVNAKKSFSFGESDTFPIYKWNGVYKFGLVYYTKDGKTNGVHTDNSMVFKTGAYAWYQYWTPSGSPTYLPESYAAKLRIAHQPPEWADYYHIVRTKELSCDLSLMVISPDYEVDGGYMYFDIHNINETGEKFPEVTKVLKYGETSFVEGDRVRVLQKYNSSSNAVIWDGKETIDLPILSVETVDGRLKLKTKYIDTSGDSSIIQLANGDKTVIEIYRPAKGLSDTDLVFYEIGYKRNVYTDSTGIRYHEGDDVQISSVVFETYSDIGNDVLVPKTFYASSNTFVTLFDYSLANVKVGDFIRFTGTSSNNGTFKVKSISVGLTITIEFEETVTDETVSGVITIEKVSDPDAAVTMVDMFGDGDYYYRARTMIDDTGTSTGSIFVADSNFSETYISSVWANGRPIVVDNDAKEEYFPAMLRFSQSYIYGTNINNLSRFYPNNFEEADASFGDILRLKTRENFIRLFQRYKTGMIPIYRQIIIDNANSSQVALSERLLNKPNYYAGEYGIDKYGSSLVSTDFGDYFLDTINKTIVRVSLDGITNMSDTYGNQDWANANIKEDSFGHGCFNYELRVVMITSGYFDESNPVGPLLIRSTIGFNESRKKFDTFYGFNTAESMLFANGLIYCMKADHNLTDDEKAAWCIWVHDNPVRNNFFGEQQQSYITTSFNANVQLKKTYVAIEELSTGIWTGNILTGPLTNQQTDVTEAEFKKAVGDGEFSGMENKFNATIKRASNKPGGKFFGEPMKGLYAVAELTNNSTVYQRLISVSLKYIQSHLTNS